jgi:hypothetical protein
MKVWQADFYKHLLKDKSEKNLWQLLICDASREFFYEAKCPQERANSDWLIEQIQQADRGNFPKVIQVFRPQSLSLFNLAGERLGIKIEATQRTQALKVELNERFKGKNYDPIKVEKAPPQALPENLWGEEWRFATFKAGDLIDYFRDRPIPFLELPDSLFPMNLGIASTVSIPGIIIYGGRKSLILARWLQEAKPFSLNYLATEVGRSGGLVLESGLSDRWIIATFEDEEVARSAQAYEQRKKASQGLHFLLVQPDDSGMTYSGFWLLQTI